jgi:hypothetical protein
LVTPPPFPDSKVLNDQQILKLLGYDKNPRQAQKELAILKAYTKKETGKYLVINEGARAMGERRKNRRKN